MHNLTAPRRRLKEITWLFSSIPIRFTIKYGSATKSPTAKAKETNMLKVIAIFCFFSLFSSFSVFDLFSTSSSKPAVFAENIKVLYPNFIISTKLIIPLKKIILLNLFLFSGIEYFIKSIILFGFLTATT